MAIMMCSRARSVIAMLQGLNKADMAKQYGAEQVQYTKDICNYIYDTYGRFPAHVDAWYTPGMWLQFSHLELEYYERYVDPALYTRQAAHDAVWHG